MAKQIIRSVRPKNRSRVKGAVIDKRSIGTVWINGQPHTYNADKVATNRINFDKPQGKRQKKKIYVTKRTRRKRIRR